MLKILQQWKSTRGGLCFKDFINYEGGRLIDELTKLFQKFWFTVGKENGKSV